MHTAATWCSYHHLGGLAGDLADGLVGKVGRESSAQGDVELGIEAGGADICDNSSCDFTFCKSHSLHSRPGYVAHFGTYILALSPC